MLRFRKCCTCFLRSEREREIRKSAGKHQLDKVPVAPPPRYRQRPKKKVVARGSCGKVAQSREGAKDRGKIRAAVQDVRNAPPPSHPYSPAPTLEGLGPPHEPASGELAGASVTTQTREKREGMGLCRPGPGGWEGSGVDPSIQGLGVSVTHATRKHEESRTRTNMAISIIMQNDELIVDHPE